MAHSMTPARRAALKKAQAASARKRRGKGKGKLAAANRKNMRLKRNIKRAAVTAGAVTAAGAAGTAVYMNRGKIKAKAANNPRVRKHVAKKMMKKARQRRARRG